MIDELWKTLGQLRQCPRSMRLVNGSPYIILCALGYAFYDERMHTVSITQTGREALKGKETMQYFEPREDGKYDLPLGMIAESGGHICYIRRVSVSLIRELATLTSDWKETLYLNVAEAMAKPAPSNDVAELLAVAQAMGFEMLAFTPLIEPGMLVYRNERGELHPVISDHSGTPQGMAMGTNEDGSTTVMQPGIVYTAPLGTFKDMPWMMQSPGPAIQGDSGSDEPSALDQLDNDAFKVGPRYSHVMVQVSPSMHEALERGRPGTSNGFLWDSDSHWVMVNTSRVTDELIQALIEQPKDWRGDAEEWGFIAEVIQAAKADQVDLITFWWHEQPNNYDLEYWFSMLMGD